ncbi:MAG: hypothetical protein NT062_21400 [Proteobacteria bacterium]|nr:hypothetical protein [Pseudomonadota bacterium]
MRSLLVNTREGLGIACVLASGCHVASNVEIVRPGAVTREILHDQITPGAPTVVVTPAGRLRFVEPLRCATTETVVQHATMERVLEPNTAAFVVGLVATAVGAIAVAGASFGDDPTGSPVFYAGGMGLALGLPLAIGPWIGTTHELVEGHARAPLVRAGHPEPCGERGLTARAATVSINTVDVRGKVDADGVFAIPLFALLDAYTPDKLRPLEVTAVLEDDGGASRTISTMLQIGLLAGAAPAYLASLEHHDARIETLRMVPGLVAGTLRVSLTSSSDGPAVRVLLPLQNTGPGDAWGVRGQIDSPVRAIDGRMLYFGHIAAGAVLTREILIPIAPDIASMIHNATIDVAVELRDGHGTAPETPVKFNGTVFVDAPRS